MRGGTGAPQVSCRARALAAAWLLLAFLIGAADATPPARAAAPAGLHVVDTQLIDATGQPIRLLGINRAGTEYACIQGWGIFDGPHDAAAIAAMRTWGINAVRVPLNEQCWLGVEGVSDAYSGVAYQRAIREWVDALRLAGLYVILDLHWAAPAGTRADQLLPMADRDYAPRFWREVATAYKDDSAVLFDLFNEPYPDNNRDTEEAWRCWRDGGTCAGFSYQAAGMQELIDAVRGTGATNVILLGGIQYANAFSRFRAYAPSDPLNNYAASWHSYDFMRWANKVTWDAQVAIPTAKIPLIASEIGQSECGTDFLLPLLQWLDERDASYLGWAWNTWNRCDGPVLIDNYDGTPSKMGQGFKDHLATQETARLAPPPGSAASAPETIATPVSNSPGGALSLYDDVIPAPFWDSSVGLVAKDPCDARSHAVGRCSYALAFSAWGGFGISRDSPFATGGFVRLELAINTHDQPLSDFTLALTGQSGGGAITAIPLDEAQVLGELGDGWTRLALPLDALNPEGVPVYGLTIRNVTGRDLRTIHLDDIRLVPPTLGVALAAGAQASGGLAMSSATPPPTP
jgi:endoglucanase